MVLLVCVMLGQSPQNIFHSSELPETYQLSLGIWLMFVPPLDQVDLLFSKAIPLLWVHSIWTSIYLGLSGTSQMDVNFVIFYLSNQY